MRVNEALPRPAGSGFLPGALVGLLLVMVLGACASTPRPPQLAAGPALWKIEGDGETLWLIGTVHRLPPEPELVQGSRIRRAPAWLSPDLRRVLRRIHDLHIETLEAPDSGLLQDFRVGRVTDTGPLDEVFGAEQLDLIAATARRYGLPPRQVVAAQPLPALLAFAYLAVPPQARDRPGVDLVLQQLARAGGKRVFGLENTAERLAVSSSALDGVAPERQIELLLSYVQEIAAEEPFDESYRAMLAAWQVGDMEAFDLALAEYRERDPELHRAFLVARNRLWLGRILPLLANGRNELVAVGIAHLAGPDSLIEMLGRDGHRVRRVGADPPARGRVGNLHHEPDEICSRGDGPGAFRCCAASC